MKIIQKKNHKKSSIFVAVVLIILVAGIAAAAYYFMFNKDTSTDTTKEVSSKTDKKPSESKKPVDDSDSSQNVVEHEKEKDTQPPYEGDDANNSASLTGVVTYKSVVDGKLLIRTTINQILDSGTCELTLSNGQKTVTRNSGIAPNPSSSTCEGFDIPTSELGSGTWKIEIKISGDDKTGTLTDSVNL